MSAEEEEIMAFSLPDLPYPKDALEPHIDAQTMDIHHGKHHKAYTDNLNDAIKGTDMEGKSIEEILSKGADALPTAVRNNGGGYANHNLFWEVMSPSGGGQPSGELAQAIERDFGSFAAFKEEFEKAAKTRFGSGWAWLVKDGGKLKVTSTPNQDTPLMEGKTPILGLDVWEHAYYLKYQNKRPDYVSAFWNVVNWDEVARRYSSAR
jgi:superoxide dismutase, Fe-Mn family